MVDNSVNLDMPRTNWAECERQLYGAAIADASRYEQILTAVRAVADGLRDIGALTQLHAAWPQAAETFASIISTSTLPVPVEQLLGAAFAIREREIQELNSRQIRNESIENARRSGHAWVTLDESGNLDAGLFAPYRSAEMHLPTGYAVISLVQPDPVDGEAVFIAMAVKLDPISGELVDAEPKIGGIESWTEHKTADDHRTFKAVLRSRIDAVRG